MKAPIKKRNGKFPALIENKVYNRNDDDNMLTTTAAASGQNSVQLLKEPSAGC